MSGEKDSRQEDEASLTQSNINLWLKKCVKTRKPNDQKLSLLGLLDYILNQQQYPQDPQDLQYTEDSQDPQGSQDSQDLQSPQESRPSFSSIIIDKIQKEKNKTGRSSCRIFPTNISGSNDEARLNYLRDILKKMPNEEEKFKLLESIYLLAIDTTPVLPTIGPKRLDVFTNGFILLMENNLLNEERVQQSAFTRETLLKVGARKIDDDRARIINTVGEALSNKHGQNPRMTHPTTKLWTCFKTALDKEYYDEAKELLANQLDKQPERVSLTNKETVDEYVKNTLQAFNKDNDNSELLEMFLRRMFEQGYLNTICRACVDFTNKLTEDSQMDADSAVTKNNDITEVLHRAVDNRTKDNQKLPFPKFSKQPPADLIPHHWDSDVGWEFIFNDFDTFQLPNLLEKSLKAGNEKIFIALLDKTAAKKEGAQFVNSCLQNPTILQQIWSHAFKVYENDGGEKANQFLQKVQERSKGLDPAPVLKGLTNSDPNFKKQWQDFCGDDHIQKFIDQRYKNVCETINVKYLNKSVQSHVNVNPNSLQETDTGYLIRCAKQYLEEKRPFFRPDTLHNRFENAINALNSKINKQDKNPNRNSTENIHLKAFKSVMEALDQYRKNNDCSNLKSLPEEFFMNPQLDQHSQTQTQQNNMPEGDGPTLFNNPNKIGDEQNGIALRSFNNGS